MDGQRFDDLARALAGGISRRGMLKGLASGTAASVLGARGVRGAAAACRRPGVLCARDNQCCSGSCDPDSHRCACPDDLTPCGRDCVDTTTDPRNCGACDVTCPHGTPCAGSTCGCPDGQTLCDHGCVDTQTDPQNCGDCGNVCSHGEGCAAGVCTCPDGQTACDHGCVDLATDPTNCGTCGNVCPHGTTCETGTCSCPAGQTLCGHGCVDTQTDFRNCGACDFTCLIPRHGSATCQEGTCIVVCDQGYTSINGECCLDSQVCGEVCCSGDTVCSIFQANACCTPEPLHVTCERYRKQCGMARNNCGTEVNCGTCDPGQSCCFNACREDFGGACHDDGDCCSGYCVAGTCRRGCSSEGGLCDAQRDCCDGTTCSNITHGVGVCCASGKACGSVCCANADAVCLADQSCCTPQPKETTCQGKCGTVRDNCGVAVDCGSCPSGQVCTNTNVCCTPAACNGRCGTFDGGCGRDIFCFCARGQVCQDGTCCSPQPIGEVCQGRCGRVTNNCGQQVDCTPVCEGCCNGDVCEPGTTNDLCGRGGAQCGACVAPETCGGGSTPGACGNTIGPGTCAAGKDFCLDGNDFSTHCNGQRFECFCLQTTRGDTFCGSSLTCSDCATNGDCTRVTGPGSACVTCNSCDGTMCVKPCPVKA